MNIHLSSFNNRTVDLLCMNCTTKSDCEGANLINACYQNRTVLGERECAQNAFCPYMCRDLSSFSYCAFNSGQISLRSLSDACSEVCSQNGTFNVKDYSYCNNSNCTLKCSASMLFTALIMVISLVFLG